MGSVLVVTLPQRAQPTRIPGWRRCLLLPTSQLGSQSSAASASLNVFDGRITAAALSASGR